MFIVSVAQLPAHFLNCHVCCQSIGQFIFIVCISSKLWSVLAHLCPLPVYCQNCLAYCQSVGPIMSMSVYRQTYCPCFVKLTLSIVSILIVKIIMSIFCCQCEYNVKISMSIVSIYCQKCQNHVLCHKYHVCVCHNCLSQFSFPLSVTSILSYFLCQCQVTTTIIIISILSQSCPLSKLSCPVSA